MEDIVDLIATDSAASDITDKIKELLYGKAGEKIEGLRPGVANSMFGEDEQVDDTESNEDQE
jgi:hypothetical protein